MSDEQGRLEVLVVDDDEQIQGALRSVLSSHGYLVTSSLSAEDALAQFERSQPDLMLVDIGLPGMSGLELCRAVRQRSEVPVVMLTVRDDEQDKVLALDMGADDYVTKPARAEEFLARIRAVLRRSGKAERSRFVRTGELEIDLDEERVTLAGEEIKLTRTEWAILAQLAVNRGRVVPMHVITRHVWGPDAKTDPQLMRVHVSNLRRKLEPYPAVPRYVMTEPGVGFRLA